MTRMLAPVLILSTTPALAHSGAHLHPHGTGNWWAVALCAGLVAAAATLVVLRK